MLLSPFRFTLNLTKGNDIAMHINPRFDDHGKKIIVRNSLIGNKWGKEERGHNHFPFTQGQPFEVRDLHSCSLHVNQSVLKL